MSRPKAQLRRMLLPYVIGLLLLVLLPLLITIILSFFAYDFVRPASFSGFDNYLKLGDDNIFHIAARNSLHYIAYAVPMRLIGALLLALLMFRAFRGVTAARVGVYSPTLIPDVAYALLAVWLFNPLYGPFNLLLGGLGIGGPDWFTDDGGARAMIIMMGLFQLGELYVVLLAARSLIASSYYETLRLEGASAWAQFKRLTLPLLTPVLVMLLLRDIAISFQATLIPALLITGGGPYPYATTYLPLFIYNHAFEYSNFGYAAAATSVMIVFTALIVWLQLWLLRRWRRVWST